jgi:hypothetical protein
MRQPRKALPDYELYPTEIAPESGLPPGLWQELNALPAVDLVSLPVPVTLWLRVEGAPATVQLTTAAGESLAAAGARLQTAQPAHSLSDRIVFERDELRALVIAAEADRFWRKQLLATCFDKWRRPDHRLTLDDALAGANPDPQGWPLARVLARLGAVVERVELAGVHDGEHGELGIAAWPAAA